MDEHATDPASARAWAMAGELRVLFGALKRRFREEAPPGDLTWSQLLVLGRIERDGPATVTSLARAVGVRPQSMGATIAALEQAGLVAGQPDAADGRQTIFSLTQACRDWVASLRAAREDWLFRAIRTTLTPEEQEQLASAIGLLKRLVEP